MAAKKTVARKSPTRGARGAKADVVFRNASPDELLGRFQDFVLKGGDVQEGLRNVQNAGGVVKLAAKHGFAISERRVRAAAKVSGGGLSVNDLGGLLAGAPC